MIDQVFIGAIRYAVHEIPDLHLIDDDGNKIRLNGEIQWPQSRIHVNNDMSVDRKLVTVWHEVLHGILENAGQDQPEPIIQAISFGLVELLRNNPQLVEMTVQRTSPPAPLPEERGER